MTIDNHTNLDDRLFIDYQYQSINWHRVSSIVIDHRFHRLGTPCCNDVERSQQGIMGSACLLLFDQSQALARNKQSLPVLTTAIVMYTSMLFLDDLLSKHA